MEKLREEKKVRTAPINFTFYDTDRLCIGDNFKKNFAYAALSRIYHELAIDKFLINRQRHTKEKYDANTIMKMLVYSRIITECIDYLEETNLIVEDVCGNYEITANIWK